MIILSSCSFDNKTGIWKNENQIVDKKDDKFKEFETLYTKTKLFNSLIQPRKNLKIILDPIKLNLKWSDEYYKDSNNLENFSYKNSYELIFKSKKLTRHEIKNKILYKDQTVIISDIKGNIIIYSINDQNIIFKYNFYKKKYKKIKKNLNLVVENDIIFISDNLGYLYALDYKNKKLLWAHDYKIPFRSNIKISKNKILLADINNSFYYINKENGEKLKIIPTEETLIKNEFVNSLALNIYSYFYLNTYGSVYSLDNKGRIKWFSNLNQSLDINPSNLFSSKPIVLYEDKLVVSTDLYLYVINSNTGSTLSKTPISSLTKPLISKNNLFLITKDNLLVCLDVKTSEILYSIDVNQSIADFLNIKKKSISIKTLALANNGLLLFLNNSYLVSFNSLGKIKNTVKLPSKPNSLPIFINDSIIYVDNKNKLIILN